MSDTKREWTEDEVEWAARCLFDLEGENITIYEHSRQITLRALQGGYVPPPRPKSVRERVNDLLDETCAWVGWRKGVSWHNHFLDALFTDFDVTPKGGT